MPLIDLAAPACVTYLNLRETVLDRARASQGDIVRATGMIVPELFKGSISFRLEVVAFEHESPVTSPQPKAATATMDALRRLAVERRPFPSIPQPTITLLHSAASEAKVADDFTGALTPGGAQLVLRIPVSMHDPLAITTALKSVDTDLVAVVRGGGDAASFAVFEDLRVLEALAACQAYRVLGLGHSANRTLAELVADHAASTPTAAGEHIRQGIVEAGKLRRTTMQLQELRETVIARDMEARSTRRLAEVPEPASESIPVTGPAEHRVGVPGWVWGVVLTVTAWALRKVVSDFL